MAELDPVTEPPRERLLKRGAEALTDSEILSILLRGRGSKLTAVQRAQLFLDLFGGSLRGLLTCNVAIAKAQKLNDEQITILLAAIELGRRLVRFPDGIDLPDPKDATGAFLLQMGTTDQEVLGAIFADVANKQLGYVECFRGTMLRLVIDTKTILREALCRNAAGILLFHFKPGDGAAEPAQRDRNFVTRMRGAGETMGIELLDYFVLRTSNWISMRRLHPW